MGEIIREDGIKEIFPVFDIEWQEKRQQELFSLFKEERLHNPDIQSLWVDAFWSENTFFAWYLSPDNRWIENGIPEWVSKIDALRKLQEFDFDQIGIGRDEEIIIDENTKNHIYKWLLTDKSFQKNLIPLYWEDQKEVIDKIYAYIIMWTK